MSSLETAVGNAASLETPEALIAPSMDKKRSISTPDTPQTGEKLDSAIATALDHGLEPQYVTGIKLALVVASVALGCFLMLVDTMVISTVSTSVSTAQLMMSSQRFSQAIPRITDEFRSLADVGWYASAYQFGM